MAVLIRLDYLNESAHLDRLDPNQPVQEWLLRIAGNQAVNFLKRQTRQKRTVEDGRIVSLHAVAHDESYELDVPDHREVPPEEKAAQQEMKTRLRALVADLPERDREVIHTLYFERMTQRAAAEVFGISRATLREINDRGLEQLRMVLSGEPAA